jgi:hypothetical protein
MNEIQIPWPQKRRELHNHHFDSTIWNDLKFRDDDIVIATYGKSGTTWVQQIVSQLLFNGAEDLEVAAISPWLDLRVPPKHVKLPVVEAQTHRRFLKTHLPVDALRFSPAAKYIYVGRDGRDFQHVQSSRQRQPAMVPGAERHSRPRRATHRETARLPAPVLSRMARRRRLSVLAVLRQCAELVGDP